MKTNKLIPKFKSEDDERDFWAKNDPLLYFNKNKFKSVIFSKLKPSTKTITIKLPEIMIESIKILANKSCVPYQSLIKIFLAERLKKELSIAKLKHNIYKS